MNYKNTDKYQVVNPFSTTMALLTSFPTVAQAEEVTCGDTDIYYNILYFI